MTTATETTETPGKRGPQGPRQWRGEPTKRERVMTESLAQAVKRETGRDVSPETVRAIRFTLPKWAKSEETSALRKNMDAQLKRAALQDKREKALAQLREAEAELKDLVLDDDVDEDDEDSDTEDSAEYEDDADDSEEDPFGESEGKVAATFG
jgi:hypothetical protein